jgi:hypothetical protein
MDFSKPTASEASMELGPGFKFKPTEEEIVMHYLRPRAVNEPFPSTFIVDVDILSHNPWDLVPGHVHIHQPFPTNKSTCSF